MIRQTCIYMLMLVTWFIGSTSQAISFVINDTIASALPIPSTGTIHGNNVSATTSAEDIPIGNLNPTNTIWFKYTARSSGIATLWMEEEFFYTTKSFIVDVYSSATPRSTNRVAVAITENNSQIGPQNFLRLQFNTIFGKTYYIRVGTLLFTGGYGRDFTLNVRQHGPGGGIDIVRVSNPYQSNPADVLTPNRSLFINYGSLSSFLPRFSSNNIQLFKILNSRISSADIVLSSTLSGSKLRLFGSGTRIGGRTTSFEGGVRSLKPGVRFATEVINESAVVARLGSRYGRLSVFVRAINTPTVSKSFTTGFHLYRPNASVRITGRLETDLVVGRIGTPKPVSLELNNLSAVTANNCRILQVGLGQSASPGPFFYSWQSQGRGIAQIFSIPARGKTNLTLNLTALMVGRITIIDLSVLCDNTYQHVSMSVDLWGDRKSVV